MKILYVSDARLPTEKAHGLQIMKTCEALARAGHDVELIVPRRRNGLTDDPFAYYDIKTRFRLRTLFTIDLIRYGRLGFWIQVVSFALGVAFTYKKNNYDSIYSRDEIALWVLGHFGFRGYIWESHTGAWNRAARYAARNARSLVVISKGLEESYVSHGIPRERITVIPSAIDLDDFSHAQEKRAARVRLGLPQNAAIALYIGRLDGWKGSATLLESARLLPAGIRVAVIGGDPRQVETLRARYPQVTFLGFRPESELADNQSAADVLVVPNTGRDVISAKFTSPLKLITAMTSGRPIIASDLPSIREIVGDEAALLVPPDDPDALARAIEKIVADVALGERLAARALEKVQGYTWDARARAIEQVVGSA